MAHVEALSRAPVTESDGTTLNYLLPERLDVYVTITQEERVLMAQTADEDIKEIIEILKKPEKERAKSEKTQARGFELLYRFHNGKKLFVTGSERNLQG
ncbi:unnamed protein product [Macrosiphum euphorbiae]|uniref:Uncharacterized protein n=1 Tax=Macrosiphum euphorbiae TaxID=13131 RepID=A0AAV0XYM1_9HEMI|nr:unnamed protein product [Macrosiphum euphorbiae]